MNCSSQKASFGSGGSIEPISDDEDFHLFKPLVGPILTRKILCIKCNGPEARSIELCNVHLNAVASRRLGDILGQSTQVQVLTFYKCNFDVIGLCAGLKNTKGVKDINFTEINFGDVAKMRGLAAILSSNPRLEYIKLKDCGIGPASITILSEALSNRSRDMQRIRWLNLSGNNFGNNALDDLVQALNTKQNEVRTLDLRGCGIGLKGCASLSRLLENQESSLSYLNLNDNSIDDDSVINLSNSLAKNTKLTWLYLDGNEEITTRGCSAMLKLLCDEASIKGILHSNHTLKYLGYYSSSQLTSAANGSLGIELTNALSTYLEMNKATDKISAARSKILWSHARGDINLGDSSIADGIMPNILAHFDNRSNETRPNHFQCYDPPLSKAKIDTLSFDATYRIIRSRANLCKNA
eukprot:CAMPEP_0183740062 /NCGR_PEP_ID=MMETSP0737-20130205/58756_1 /TAXON_ID=385413 /ORGANISM="Thalassiosira miniscula, Strain CCMP1093" /LENGTH=410 /DNA_ID=CAMNT_0025975047 /DNA_START=138 /DNA_END=1370 /DNA_ORIENTATION=+